MAKDLRKKGMIFHHMFTQLPTSDSEMRRSSVERVNQLRSTSSLTLKQALTFMKEMESISEHDGRLVSLLPVLHCGFNSIPVYEFPVIVKCFQSLVGNNQSARTLIGRVIQQLAKDNPGRSKPASLLYDSPNGWTDLAICAYSIPGQSARIVQTQACTELLHCCALDPHAECFETTKAILKFLEVLGKRRFRNIEDALFRKCRDRVSSHMREYVRESLIPNGQSKFAMLFDNLNKSQNENKALVYTLVEKFTSVLELRKSKLRMLSLRVYHDQLSEYIRSVVGLPSQSGVPKVRLISLLGKYSKVCGLNNIARSELRNFIRNERNLKFLEPETLETLSETARRVRFEDRFLLGRLMRAGGKNRSPNQGDLHFPKLFTNKSLTRILRRRLHAWMARHNPLHWEKALLESFANTKNCGCAQCKLCVRFNQALSAARAFHVDN